MEKTQSLKNIAAALLQFQKEVEKIKKTSQNPFFKSNYAGLPEILDSISEPLQHCGLVITQFPTGEDELTTILLHAESGEYLQATNKMRPVKSDPQSLGSAITYNRRYSIGAILCLNIDEDDDGNKASEPKPEKKMEKTQESKPEKTEWLSEKQFKQAIERRDVDTINKVLDTFKIKKEWFSALVQLKNELKLQTQVLDDPESEVLPF